MDLAPVYLIQRFFVRILDFFHHWYVHGSRRFAHAFISSLEQCDELFAAKITLIHFFEPLYGDYSPIGRVLGITFRFWRIVFGGIVYVAITLVFAAAYLIWIFIPAVLVLGIAQIFSPDTFGPFFL